jgi:hypothetical protein
MSHELYNIYNESRVPEYARKRLFPLEISFDIYLFDQAQNKNAFPYGFTPFSSLFVALCISRLLGHLETTLESLVATDETRSVDKDTAGDTRDLAQLLVSDTLPGIGHILAVLEAARLAADGANAPLAVRLAVLGKEDVENRALGGSLLLESVEVVGPGAALRTVRDNHNATLVVVLETVAKGFLDDSASRQPRVELVHKLRDELVTAELRGLEETLVFLGLYFGGRLCSTSSGQRDGDAALGADALGAEGVLSDGDGSRVRVVEAVDNRGNAEATVIELLVNASLAESIRVVGGNTVVVGIESLDKVIVQLLVEQLGVGRVLGETGAGADDVLGVVHVDETGRRELGGVTREGSGELALVVIVALGRVIVNTTDIDDGVAGSELFGVTGTDQSAVGVGGQQAQQVDGEGLVGVEVAAVGSDKRA